jgi:hypothetical protein
VATIEEIEKIGVADVGELIASLKNAYPVTASREEIAKRLYRFLLRVSFFTKEELKLNLWIEKFLGKIDRPFYKKESPFIRSCTHVILHELEKRGYITGRGSFFEVLIRPSFEECLDILRIQVFNLLR